MSFADWFLKPTKKQLLIIVTIWLLGLICLVIASTNGFTESPFQKKYIVINFFTASSFFSILGVIANYYRYRSK